MKKTNLKKLMLLGLAGGLVLGTQSVSANETVEQSMNHMLANGCGAGKCNGQGGSRGQIADNGCKGNGGSCGSKSTSSNNNNGQRYVAENDYTGSGGTARYPSSNVQNNGQNGNIPGGNNPNSAPQNYNANPNGPANYNQNAAPSANPNASSMPFNGGNVQPKLAGNGCGAPNVPSNGCNGRSQPRGSNNTAGCHGQGPARGYVADNATAQTATQATMTESELLTTLNPQAKAMYQGMDADGKALALKLANQSCKGNNDCKGLNSCKTSENSCAGQGSCKGKTPGPFKDKNVAVKTAALKMAQKRASVNG